MFERNHILKHIPSHEREIIQKSLELISLEPKEEINLVESRVRHVYFPTDSVISLMDLRSNGQAVEVAVIGVEGCTAFTLVHGYNRSPCRVIVQVGGSAFRVKADDLRDALPKLPYLRYALTRLSGLILREAIISVGCSQFHSVEQRLGRWLLAHRFRTGLNVFEFTHGFLAEQLGVQRATVTEALAGLQKQNILKYGYGSVEVSDAKTLENKSCECFHQAKSAVEDYLLDIQSSMRSQLSW